MSRLRGPPSAGIVACLAVVIVVLLPYAVPDLGTTGVEAYYDYGLAGPWGSLVLAAIGVVVFAAGRERRTAPDLAAGAGLGIGLAATVLSILWAAAVPYEVVVQLTTATWFEYHRLLVVVASATPIVCSLWWAYELELF